MTIGLIGCGIWGRNILNELLQLNTTVWVIEPDVSLHDSITNVGGIIKNTIDELAQIDGVIIATPSSTHRMILEQLMPFEIPLFVEKPLTTSYIDALALQKIVHNKVFLMHIWRYHAGIKLLGQIVRSGRIGEITALYSTRTNWTSPRTDTDCIWNLAPHDLTIAIEILGYIPAPRLAVAETHTNMPRAMTAILGQKPFVQIEVSNRDARKRREVRVQGTKGVAILANEKVDYIEVYEGDEWSFPQPNYYEKIYFDGTQSPLKLEIKAFINYINGGNEPISNFEEGLKTIEILTQLRTLAGINS
jgi:predicted dehydrogenase